MLGASGVALVTIPLLQLGLPGLATSIAIRVCILSIHLRSSLWYGVKVVACAPPGITLATVACRDNPILTNERDHEHNSSCDTRFEPNYNAGRV